MLALEKTKKEATNCFISITQLKSEELTQDQIQEMNNKVFLVTKLNQSVSRLETLKQQLSQQAEDKSKTDKAAEKLSKAAEKLSKLESLAEAAEKRLKLASSELERLENGFDVQSESIDCNDAFDVLSASPKRLKTHNKHNSLNSVGQTIISSIQNNNSPLSQQTKDFCGDFDEKSEEAESKLSVKDKDHHHSDSARSSSSLQLFVQNGQDIEAQPYTHVESQLIGGEVELSPATNPYHTTTDSLRSRSNSKDSGQKM